MGTVASLLLILFVVAEVIEVADAVSFKGESERFLQGEGCAEMDERMSTIELCLELMCNRNSAEEFGMGVSTQGGVRE